MKKFLIGLMKSRTFWSNALMGITYFFNEASGQIIPSDLAVKIVIGSNILLRMITTKALNQK